MSIETVADLIHEGNKWLKLKIKTADTLRELPTLDGMRCFMEKLLQTAWEPNYSHIFTKGVNNQRYADKQPRTNANVFVLLGLELACVVVEHGKPTVLDLRCNHGEGTEETILRFYCTFDQCEIDGEKVTYLKQIGLEPGKEDQNDESLLDIFLKTELMLSDKLGYDIVTRWQKQPIHLRERNPICPVCQGKPRLSRDQKNQSILFCSCCSWASKYEYYYLSDFVDPENFGREYKAVRHAAKYDEARDKNIEDLSQSLDRVIKAFEHRKYKDVNKDQAYRKKLRSLCEDAIKAIDPPVTQQSPW